MDLNKIEYRLTYKIDSVLEHKFFDDVNSAYEYILENRLLTFALVKEELIAQRWQAPSERSNG